MRYLIVAIIFSPFAIGQEVTLTSQQLNDLGIEVVGYTIRNVKPENRDDCKYFHYNDTDKDGIFDRICVGLIYNPCDRDSVYKAYDQWQQQGNVCRDRECDQTTVSPYIGAGSRCR